MVSDSGGIRCYVPSTAVGDGDSLILADSDEVVTEALLEVAAVSGEFLLAVIVIEDSTPFG